MKSYLFLISLLLASTSLCVESHARTSRTDAPFILYRLNDKQIHETEFDEKITGTLESFHKREKLTASFSEGNLDGAFTSTEYEGLVNNKNTFSVQDRNKNFAKGEIVCAGIDAYKSFIAYLSDPIKERKEELYKCLLLSKASYLDEYGTYFMEGGLSFPVLMQDTTLSFLPKSGVFSPLNQTSGDVKQIEFKMNKDAHQMGLDYQFVSGYNLSLEYDFVNGFLSELLSGPLPFLKQLAGNNVQDEFVLKSIVIPRENKKDGLVFSGKLHSKTGFSDQSSLKLLTNENQKVAEISYLNETFFVDLKYPQSMTSILEGELKNLNSSNQYALLATFILNFLNNPMVFFTDENYAKFLSGLELKNVTLYDIDNRKKAVFDITFSKITKQMIETAKNNPQTMDLWVKGSVTLFDMPNGALTVLFNATDEVVVNDKAGNGKGAADFYGILKLLQKQMNVSLRAYIQQMKDVLKDVAIIGPLYQEIESKLKIKNILEVARNFALKNYAFCVNELENEKIDYMYDCQGINAKDFASWKHPNGAEISLPNQDIYPLIQTDKRSGQDMVYLTLKFVDKDLCEKTALQKKTTCKENEITAGFKTDLKTY